MSKSSRNKQPQSAEERKKELRRAGVLHIYKRIFADGSEVVHEVLPGQSHDKAWAAVMSA